MIIAPLMDAPAGETMATLLSALGVGVAFGFALERGGLGSARKLAAQFYLRDFTVIKVMFAAIVTAMLGLHWLASAGLLDPARVHVPPTYLGAQLAGGLLFGVGFVLGGLCPGTACVAGASGRLDGLAAVVGLLAGTIGFELLRPALGTATESGARGVLRLPELLGLPEGTVVAIVTALALATFAIAERVEARRGDGAAPPASRRGRRALAAAASVLALGAMVPLDRVPVEQPGARADDLVAIARAVEEEADHVTALELARWLREGKPGLRVVDVRPESAWRELSIPGSTHSSLASLVRAPVRAGETLVLYSEGGTHAGQGWVLLRARGHERVYVLRGGLYEWITDVVDATLPADADPTQRAAWPERAALSRWFGGQPRVLDPSDTPSAVPLPRRAPIEEDAVAGRRVRRLGC